MADSPRNSENAAELRAMAEAFMPLARKMARRFSKRSGLRFDECEAAAYFGLARAADKFDPARGRPFAALARKKIFGALRDELRSSIRAARVESVDYPEAFIDAAADRPDEIISRREEMGRLVERARDVVAEIEAGKGSRIAFIKRLSRGDGVTIPAIHNRIRKARRHFPVTDGKENVCLN